MSNPISTVAEQVTLAAAQGTASSAVSLIDLVNDPDVQRRFGLARAKRTETPGLGQRPKLHMLDPREMFVDEIYQRDMRPDHVLNIALNFSWDQFQALSVMKRKDPDDPTGRKFRYFLTEGQHRAAAAILVGLDKVPCLVYDSRGVQDEARQFYGINSNRRAVPLVVKHQNAVILGNQKSNELQEIVNKAGFLLVEGTPSQPNEYNNLSSLSVAIRKGGEENTLKAVSLIRQAWPAESVNGVVMTGVTIFLKLYGRNKRYDEAMLLNTLQSYPTQKAVMEGIDQRKRETRNVRENLIASDLADAYNKVNGLKGGKMLNRGPVEVVLARRITTAAKLDEAAGVADLTDSLEAQARVAGQARSKRRGGAEASAEPQSELFAVGNSQGETTRD